MNRVPGPVCGLCAVWRVCVSDYYKYTESGDGTRETGDRGVLPQRNLRAARGETGVTVGTKINDIVATAPRGAQRQRANVPIHLSCDITAYSPGCPDSLERANTPWCSAL